MDTEISPVSVGIEVEPRYSIGALHSSWGFICTVCNKDATYYISDSMPSPHFIDLRLKEKYLPVVAASVCSEECFNIWLLKYI